MEFKIGDIYTDAETLKEANDAMKNLTEKQLEDILEKNEGLKKRIEGYDASTL